jgi:quercetin dioxygenase-like cupin family protein
MTITFIDTGDCPQVKLEGKQGEVAEILNRRLCGAESVLGVLRWLDRGERLTADSPGDAHQLIYLMEGAAVITLENKDYEVSKGAGVYLGPEESASIRHAGAATLKLLHLVVPKPGG